MVKKRRRPTAGRRPGLLAADLRRRLGDVEQVARANRRELELQFRRIADMQAEIDKLKKG